MKLLSIVAALAAAALIAYPATAAVGRSISVSGSSTLRVAPDRAVLGFGVSKSAQTAAGALSAANAALAQVIAALKSAGVADKDIQTSQISLDPRTDAQGRQTGFNATESVTVSSRALDSVGTLIDHAVGAGANQVSGPSFSRSNIDAIYRHALQNAYTQARAKALSLAARAGVKLGRATTISESTESTPLPLGASQATKDSSTPVQPGQIEVDATVDVSFAIR